MKRVFWLSQEARKLTRRDWFLVALVFVVWLFACAAAFAHPSEDKHCHLDETTTHRCH